MHLVASILGRMADVVVALNDARAGIIPTSADEVGWKWFFITSLNHAVTVAIALAFAWIVYQLRVVRNKLRYIREWTDRYDVERRELREDIKRGPQNVSGPGGPGGSQ